VVDSRLPVPDDSAVLAPAGPLARPRGGRGLLPHLIALAAFPTGWFLITLVVPRYALPPPQDVGTAMVNIVARGDLWPHASATLWRVLLSTVGAMLVGSVLGVLMGVNRYTERFFRNWVYMGLSMPGVVMAMIAVLWFGINELSVLVAVVVIVFPYVSVTVYEGVKAVDKSLLDMGRAYRVPGRDMVRRIVLPSLSPYIIAAIRLAFANCWKMATLAEVFSASIGIGYMIRVQFEFFNMAWIMAWTLTFAVLILAIEYGFINPVRARLLSWRPEIGEVF
jgi:NitT/TauT family transport system permease protein